MDNVYVKPTIQTISKDKMFDNIRKMSDECKVECTYMYAYCGDEDGWGSTYCPKWNEGENHN